MPRDPKDPRDLEMPRPLERSEPSKSWIRMKGRKGRKGRKGKLTLKSGIQAVWGILKCVQDRACSSLLASARTEIVVNSVTYPTTVDPHIWTSATASF
mmetsp:Transcript_55069/g.89677  ORF Transcript_55069/g.89677 Transcript_55069/m.89677 type:complete len:98 (+) Transcript_55069:277-570(+)